MTATHQPVADPVWPQDTAEPVEPLAGSPIAAPPPPAPTISWTMPPGRFRQTLSRVPAWVAPLALGGLAATSCLYVAMIDPNQPNSTFLPQCTFKVLTGFDCPGCGLTRAMHSLLTGDPFGAVNHNIFILLIFPLAVYTYTRWLLQTTVGWEIPAVRLNKNLGLAVPVVVAVFWILRNIPWGPFTFLNAAA